MHQPMFYVIFSKGLDYYPGDVYVQVNSVINIYFEIKFVNISYLLELEIVFHKK